jgi:uncharacterized protein (TIGR03382 family)
LGHGGADGDGDADDVGKGAPEQVIGSCSSGGGAVSSLGLLFVLLALHRKRR